MNATTQKLLTAALPWVLAAAGGIGALAAYNHGQREIGKRELLMAGADSALHAQGRALDSIAKVKHVDTLRLVHWDTTYAAAREIRDTVIFHDSVFVPVQVVRTVVAAADSTIKACRDVLTDCERQRLILAADTVAWQRKYTLLEEQAPSAIVPWRDRALGALVALGIKSLYDALHK